MKAANAAALNVWMCFIRVYKFAETSQACPPPPPFKPKPARRQEISDDKAPRFSWDTQAGMHLLTQSTATTANDRKRIALGTLADEVFGDKQRLKWVALRDAIMTARGWAKSTGDNKIEAMLDAKVINKCPMGFYEKGQP